MNGKTATAMSLMLLAAAMWGFSGFFSREIMGAGFSAYEVTAVRTLLAVVILFFILLIFDRGALKLHRRDIPLFVFFGFMKLLTDLTLFISQESVNLSMSATLQMMSPIYVLLITVAFFGSKATHRKILGVVLSLVGCVLVTGVIFEAGSYSTVGILAGMSSGIAYGVYTIGAKISIMRGYTPSGTLFWMFLVSAIVSLFVANPLPVLSAAATDLHMTFDCIGLAVLITLVPYWLQAISMKNLDSNTVNIIGVFEAVVAALVGFAIYGEVLTALNILGMVLVFGSIILMGEEKDRNPDTV